MRKKLIYLALFILPAAASAAESVPVAPDPVPTLLARAKLWEARGRDDLAINELKRVLLTSPDNPQALAAIGALDIKAGNLAEAKEMLDHLRKVAPDQAALTRLQDMLRLYGPDKEKLRQARLLASSGRKKEALEKFRELYPNGPPDPDLALEYWQLVSDLPEGYEPAKQGISNLTRENPDNLKYRLALAKLETSHAPLNRRALDTLIELSKTKDYGREAKAAWRNTVLRFGDDPANIPLLRAYLAEDPQDTAISQQLEETVRAREKAQKAAEERKKLLADPYYQAGRQGISLLDEGKLDEAEKRLAYSLSGRPDDAEVLGAMGLLRFRQGYAFEAQAYFLKAKDIDPRRNDKWVPLLRASRFWGYMKEYDDADSAGEADLAERKVRAALSVDPDEPNGLAALGHVLYGQGKMEEAERTYRKALGIQTANASALGGLVTLYLKTGRAEEARQLLGNLTAKQKTALGSTYDSLRAGLLRQEADRFAAQGNLPQAAADLEEAAGIDPDDPWLRYDLAKLYLRENQGEKIKPLFDAYLEKHPDDPSGLYAYALLQSSQDEYQAALALLDRIPVKQVDEKIAGFKKRLLFAIRSEQARSLSESGKREEAEKILSQMEQDAKGDADLSTDVAYGWVNVGNPSHASQLLQGIEAGNPSLPASWHLRYASFLSRIDAQDALAAELEKISSMQNLTPDEAISLKNLKESFAIRVSESMRQAGKPGEAAQNLAPFLKENPDGTDLLLEQAKIALDMNQSASAEEAYRHVLVSDPGNSDALEGLASLYLKSGRNQEAAKLLANLSEKQKGAMGKSYNSIRSSLLRQEADRLASQGNRPAAAQKLEQSVGIDPDDPWLRYDLAKLYLVDGNASKAKSLFDDYLARHPADPSGLYAYALLQSSSDQDEAALATLDGIPLAQRSEKISGFRTELVEKIAIRESEALQKNGRTLEARKRLAPLLASNPDSPRLLYAMAGIENQEKHYPAAESDYRRILVKNPGEKRARRGLVDSMVDGGNLLKALNQVDTWLSSAETADTQTRLEEIGILIDLEDYPNARAKLDRLLAAEPGNAEALAYARKLSARANPAFQPYPVAKLMGEESQLPSWLHKEEKAPVKDQRLSKSEAKEIDSTVTWVSAAADIRSRSGTPGESQITSVEIPVEYKTPLKSGGQAFARMDAVRLDAGTIAPNAGGYGTMLFCQPNCPSLQQQANGASVTVGYSRGSDLRLDIGTTPLGFPVTHIVGGILQKGDLGPFSYSIDLSRRPLSSTLLSYAGARDPRTGLSWGGVVATGPRFGLSLDNGGAFGAWSSLELHKLTGVNVQTNVRKRFMAGGYWRAINEDDMELKVGLTGMYWKYDVDAGEFTFGHGGYYSPQRYRSISLPVSFGQRISNFAYVLRASVSASNSTFNAAPYYPTNQAMQAQGNTFYTASSGPGHGYSLLADWEYLIAPELYLGGQFDVERSVYYAPNHMLVYLRHPIGGKGAQQVFLPPELFEPTSQF